MARIRSDLQIEKGLPSGNKVLAKPDGQTEVVQIEPYKVSSTTWVVDSAGIYENVPGQFEIPSLPYAKDVDTAISDDGKIYRYNSAGYFTLEVDLNSSLTFLESIGGGAGVDVDNTDPQNPIVGLDQASQDSLDLADSAVQPGDLADVATSGDFGDLQNVPNFIEDSEKGAVNGVAPLGADQKVPNQYLPAIAISEVIEATENDITTFAANSANYTFQTGDVILIDDSGNLKHYIYKGGIKTDVNEYSLINATQVDWNNVTGKPTDLQDNLFTKDLALAATRQHDLSGNMIRFNNGIFYIYNDTHATHVVDVQFTPGDIFFYTYRNDTFAATGLRIVNGDLIIYDGNTPVPISRKNVFLKQVGGNAEWQALTIPEYPTDTDADNDGDLASNAPYAITGERGVKVKNGAPIPDYYLQQLYLSQEDFHLQQKYTYDTGVQDFMMDYDFQDVVDVFVNGTRLARTEYTLTYNKVTIEAALTQGDKVVINYTHRCDFDKVYGIKRDKTIASPDWERIGKDMTLHASLPVQSGMRRCVLDDNGDVVYYLDANDSSLKEDGVTPAVLDGTDGQLMVEIPRHFERFNEYDGVQYVFISTDPFPGAFMVEKMYVSTDECAIHRPSNTLASVINTTADYRGGNNQSAWDATASSMLGMAVTATSLIDFNTYARNRGDGWRCMYYDVHRVIAWLITIEYATYYHQQPYNPTLTPEGYRQGGLGDGPTRINSADWNTFNGRYPLIPIGTTLSLGNNSGEVVYTIQDFPTAGNTQDITSNSYRGIANWYGHLFEWTDGIRFEASNGGATREIFKEVGEAYSTNDTVGYKSIGFTPQANGYITEIIFSKDGDIIAKENSGGSSATYLTDYFYMSSSDGYKGLLRSGSALSGASAGSFVASSANGATVVYSNLGSRLCFFPEKRETDA